MDSRSRAVAESPVLDEVRNCVQRLSLSGFRLRVWLLRRFAGGFWSVGTSLCLIDILRRMGLILSNRNVSADSSLVLVTGIDRCSGRMETVKAIENLECVSNCAEPAGCLSSFQSNLSKVSSLIPCANWCLGSGSSCSPAGKGCFPKWSKLPVGNCCLTSFRWGSDER